MKLVFLKSWTNSGNALTSSFFFSITFFSLFLIASETNFWNSSLIRVLAKQWYSSVCTYSNCINILCLDIYQACRVEDNRQYFSYPLQMPKSFKCSILRIGAHLLYSHLAFWNTIWYDEQLVNLLWHYPLWCQTGTCDLPLSQAEDKHFHLSSTICKLHIWTKLSLRFLLLLEVVCCPLFNLFNYY